MRPSATVRLGLVAALGASLVAILPVTAVAEERPAGDPAPLSRAEKVPGKNAAAKPVPSDPVWEKRLKGTPDTVWPTPAAVDVPLTTARTRAVRAKGLPVRFRTPAAGADGPAPSQVSVELLDRARATRAGVNGELLTLRRSDGGKKPGPVDVELDYSGFRDAFGGDWAARLRIVSLPACATTTPDKAECRKQTPLRTHNSLSSGTASARVVTADQTSVYALTAAADGPTGDYEASPLSPSATWQTALQSGSFSATQEFSVPDVPGGLKPQVALSYSSGGVDGRTVATNNQPSWAGEGWNLWSGYVSWSHGGCVDQGVPNSGDLCWGGDQASIVFNGKATALVYDANRKVWRLKDDDGSRVDLMTGASNGDRDGNFWRVTTTDGTQYFFGRQADAQSTWTVPVFGNNDNEPCKAATFATSWCQQAWRWNLDYVVDRAGNTMKYFYTKENNFYGINLAAGRAEYTRGGVLDRIEYGAKEGQSPVAQVTFDTAPRCREGADCAKHESFPDVPFDRECTTATCPEKFSPTFWTTKRLAKVSTFLAGTLLDSWTLQHGFPVNGDGTAAGLWLQQVTHTGHRGGTPRSDPPTKYFGTPEPNRVNTAEDGLPPMLKHRIHTIYNESGGKTEVNWAAHDCAAGATPAPADNTKRCFPVRWAPPGAAAVDDWFRKYVVAEVVTDDRVGGSLPGKTSYEYVGGGAWHYDDNPLVKEEYRTWSQWRGYAHVKVRTGNTASEPDVRQTERVSTFFRGMHGDRASRSGGVKTPKIKDSTGTERDDLDGLQGFVLEERTHDGVDGAEVSGTITLPSRQETAAQGSSRAYVVRPGTTLGRTAVTGGSPRTTEVVHTYDTHGILTKTDDRGDTATTEDDQCTTTTYARNPDAWILTLPSRTHTVGVACDGTAVFPRDSISDLRYHYDGGAHGQAPTAGYVTRQERVRDYVEGEPEYLVVAETTYDTYGRPLTESDALKRTTTTGYEPATGLPKTMTVANPKQHKVVTSYDAAGQVESTVDANDKKTEFGHDALGRLTAVWRPGRVKGADSPHVRYDYRVRNDGTSWVATERLAANQNTLTSYTIYDGFMRERQTQAHAWVEAGTPPGRVVTDKIYDSRGLVVKENNRYWGDGAAAGDLYTHTSGDAIVPSQTRLTYDGAAREVKAELYTGNQPASETWFTTTEYRGDMTVVTPPKGGTKTATLVDARGRQTEVRQIGGTNVTTTRYSYTKAGQLAAVTDTVGNQWVYDHDVLGRATRRSDPDTGAVTLTYDEAGQLESRDDARQGKVITYDYDELGRNTATWDGTTQLTATTYDRPGALGQVASSTRFSGGVAYSSEVLAYDDGYRPTEEVVTVPAAETGLAGEYRTTAEYNPDGSLKRLGAPRLSTEVPGEELSYGYDTFGLLSTVTGTDTYVGYTRYTEFGEPEMIRRGKVGLETWTRWDYGPATRRVSQIAVDRRNATGFASDLRYGYDEAGNITKQTTHIAGQTFDAQCYGYDHLRRMTESWSTASDCAAGVGKNVGGPAPYWTSYGYDEIGNRQTETEHGLNGVTDTVSISAYPAAKQPRPHAPTSITTKGPQGTRTATFSYTETGTARTRPGPSGVEQTLDWDAEDRLVSTSAGTGYVYNLDGSRLVSRDDKGKTLYLPTGEVRWDKATGKVTGTRYYQHNSETVGVKSAAGLNWLSHDLNGTDVIAVKSDLTKVTTRRLDPFGEVRGTAAAWPSTRGFVGGATEQATGLTSLGVRAYDPAGGKFVAVDPLLDPTDPDHLNGYSYAKNSPVTLTDPDGRFPRTGNSPDGECDRGCAHKPGQGPASTFNGALPLFYQKPPDPWNPPKPVIKTLPGPSKSGKPGFPASCTFDKCRALQPWQVPPTECKDQGRLGGDLKCIDALTQQQKDKSAYEEEQRQKNKPKVNPMTLSVCVAAWAQMGGMAGGDVCLTFDSHGVGVSAAGKVGAGPAVGAGLDLGIKFSEGTIEDVPGPGTWGGVPVGLVGVEGGQSDGGQRTVGISAGPQLGIGGPSFGREYVAGTRLIGDDPSKKR
ncbi:RHS repeat domain-containing protein [Actinophytocola algeriensis]|uniref:RHS repeat-associated protein n=1 Tax=Actinophytocola algeriensis TaxID=1768010 RepID=A0A7W7Q713_9PSEU|nr:RHS repeat-associated core domain-containing protein [Actinophytocola algeriensis]MBB4908267.1 RHS repeat-associated protein [Actinophytocola algeriensis]MBE1480297.1 RHS repeat-associated protein [Actinophytocola algeriensis]